MSRIHPPSPLESSWTPGNHFFLMKAPGKLMVSTQAPLYCPYRHFFESYMNPKIYFIKGRKVLT